MKHLKTTISVFLIISLFSCKGQENFEGIITYRLKYSSSDPNVNIEDTRNFNGKSAQFFFKEGNMRWNIESNYWRSNTYLVTENKAFMETQTDTIFWENGSELSEKVISSRVKKGVTTIKGYPCDLLTLELQSLVDSTTRTKRIYYNNKHQVDPNIFSRCNWNNFNFIYSHTKSLPLKIIDNFGTVTMEYEATSIEERPIDPEVFTINRTLPMVEIK